MSELETVMLKSRFLSYSLRVRLGCGCVSEYNISNINLILQYTNLDKENTKHTLEVYIWG